MAKLTSFTFLTLNGCYKGPGEDISWHRHGGDENEYAEEGIKSDTILVFGRKTYEMMASYWPTALAMTSNPVMAEGMNKAGKIVFSKTLKKAGWNNSTLLTGNLEAEMKRLKASSDKDLTVLGSGNLLSQLAELGLVDEFQFMIDPVVIPNGTILFHETSSKLDLNLVSHRVMKSGVVLLNYKLSCVREELAVTQHRVL